MLRTPYIAQSATGRNREGSVTGRRVAYRVAWPLPATPEQRREAQRRDDRNGGGSKAAQLVEIEQEHIIRLACITSPSPAGAFARSRAVCFRPKGRTCSATRRDLARWRSIPVFTARTSARLTRAGRRAYRDRSALR